VASSSKKPASEINSNEEKVYVVDRNKIRSKTEHNNYPDLKKQSKNKFHVLADHQK